MIFWSKKRKEETNAGTGKSTIIANAKDLDLRS